MTDSGDKSTKFIKLSPLKGFPMYMKVGIVTGSIGVCSRQARRVTRANGNVRGAAYLASWPQLQRVAFSSSREREWISCKLAAPRPLSPAGTTCTLRPDGVLNGCWCWRCAALCAAKDWSLVWQTWLSLSSPTLLLLANQPSLLSSMLHCFEHASCFVKELILIFRLEFKSPQKGYKSSDLWEHLVKYVVMHN